MRFAGGPLTTFILAALCGSIAGAAAYGQPALPPGASPATPGAPPPAPHPGFLRAFAETRGFLLGRPTKITPTPDGKAVLFLRSLPRKPDLALYELDVASGKTRELVTPAALLGGAEEKLSTEEKSRRERMRIVDRGFTSFDLSDDGRRVLLPLSGQLHVYERSGGQTGKARVLLARQGPGTPAVLDPRFSPDGSKVAYVRGHDLYVADVATGRERRLTTGGSAQLTHGIADHIAQEEMSRFEGFFWSPDSRLLAYTEVDHDGLERFSIGDPTHPEIPANVFPYPRPGKANTTTRLGIVPAAGGATTWVKWESGRYPYLARVIWKEKGAPLTLQVQTRDQREAALLAVDADSGSCRPLLLDKDDAWVELDDRLPRWLPGGSGFLAVSERSGRRVLNLHRPDGTLERPLHQDRFHDLVHVSEDAKKAYVLTATPLYTRLWEVAVRGNEAPVALTTDESEHNPVFAKRAPLYVDTRVAANALPVSTVYRAEGGRWKALSELPQVAEAPPFRVNLALTTVQLGAGAPPYHVAVVRPRGFRREQRYPVIVSVYGGPSVNTVRSDERAYLLAQWMADHGAVVVSIDNRGTPRRDRAWSRSIKGSFGKILLDDQIDVLKALGTRHPELDLGRVGIYGWSFGGYMSALAVLKRPDIFKVAVAGAPVVDWHDYDTHYTERYLDLPDANPKGYAESNLLTYAYAAKISRPLLIVHGTTDDNVYFFHSLKLANALFRAGKPFDFLPLTVTHQVPDPVVREQLWNRIADYLLRHLR